MIDGLTEDTGSEGLTLEAAGEAISGLLSGIVPEDKQQRRAPAPKTETPEGEQTDDEGKEARPESEVESKETDEAPEPPKTEPRKLKVKLPEGEQELPEDEVVKGYLRTADYTRKTQELAEKRKAHEAEETAVKQERQRYAIQLAQLDELLTQATPPEPDWDSLRADPAVFTATYAEWKLQQETREKVRAERQKAEEKVMQDRIAEHNAMLQREREALLAAVPAWSDPDVAKREMTDLVEYASGHGFTPEELNAVTDHRVIKILRDAAAFKKAQAKAPVIEKKIEHAKVMAPGSTTAPKKEVTDLTRAKQALAKTGSLRDAGAAISLLLAED